MVGAAVVGVAVVVGLAVVGVLVGCPAVTVGTAVVGAPDVGLEVGPASRLSALRWKEYASFIRNSRARMMPKRGLISSRNLV